MDDHLPFPQDSGLIADEFNYCGHEGQCEGGSVITICSAPLSVSVLVHPDGDMEASFSAIVHCRYGDLGKSFASEAEVIQHLFYDLGGVAGDFKMHPVN